MTDKRYTTIRTNTIKCDIQKLMKELKDNNIKFEIQDGKNLKNKII